MEPFTDPVQYVCKLLDSTQKGKTSKKPVETENVNSERTPYIQISLQIAFLKYL